MTHLNNPLYMLFNLALSLSERAKETLARQGYLSLACRRRSVAVKSQAPSRHPARLYHFSLCHVPDKPYGIDNAAREPRPFRVTFNYRWGLCYDSSIWLQIRYYAFSEV